MLTSKEGLLEEVRGKFAQVEACPVEGPRIFFENAGGALTLKSVVETSKRYAAIPDNQGRANEASRALMETIAKARADARIYLGATTGQIFTGESGSELLFRIISEACLGAGKGGIVLGSTLEHPASSSAARRWSGIAGQTFVAVPHNDNTGTVTVDHYLPHITDDVRVATIIHTSPVTGMGVDVGAISKAIRARSPDCFIIVDGIQHAAHGGLDVDAYDIDGYVISPYKVFSRHGYGLAWISDRLTAVPHNELLGGPEGNWELGTRDTGSYATFSDVVDYFVWLGGHFTDNQDSRARMKAAGEAIHAHEHALTDAMIHGTGNLKGLAQMEKVTILGGVDNPAREGLVSLMVDGVDPFDLVEQLRQQGIRTHVRKADHYSGNILKPLGLEGCVRVSLCHYNSEHEVAQFLAAMQQIAA